MKIDIKARKSILNVTQKNFWEILLYFLDYILIVENIYQLSPVKKMVNLTKTSEEIEVRVKPALYPLEREYGMLVYCLVITDGLH